MVYSVFVSRKAPAAKIWYRGQCGMRRLYTLVPTCGESYLGETKSQALTEGSRNTTNTRKKRNKIANEWHVFLKIAKRDSLLLSVLSGFLRTSPLCSSSSDSRVISSLSEAFTSWERGREGERERERERASERASESTSQLCIRVFARIDIDRYWYIAHNFTHARAKEREYLTCVKSNAINFCLMRCKRGALGQLCMLAFVRNTLETL